MTFWDLNYNSLQLEIIGLPVGLGLALANYFHAKSLYFAYGAPHLILG